MKKKACKVFDPFITIFAFIVGERTVALEFFMASINFFFGLYFLYSTDTDLKRSIIIAGMLKVFPHVVWTVLFFTKAVFSFSGNITGSLRLRRYAAVTHIFLWGIIDFYIFKLVPFPSYVHGIYTCLFLTGVWAYLSIQNETRIFKSGRQTMTITIRRDFLDNSEIKSRL